MARAPPMLTTTPPVPGAAPKQKPRAQNVGTPKEIEGNGEDDEDEEGVPREIEDDEDEEDGASAPGEEVTVGKDLLEGMQRADFPTNTRNSRHAAEEEEGELKHDASGAEDLPQVCSIQGTARRLAL